jgi:hypothetical protein
MALGCLDGTAERSLESCGKCDSASDVELPTFRICEDAALPTDVEEEGFEHLGSNLISILGAEHSAQDVLATTGGPVTVVGKFAYGRSNRDLEDEWIEVWMDDCSGEYRHLGDVLTDGDGRIALALEETPEVGRYALYLRVRGDGTAAHSTLRVVPRGTQVVVFDIDGTLSSSDLAFYVDTAYDYFLSILIGEFVPDARRGAREVTEARYDAGYLLVYLTGRPYWVTRSTREWLEVQGMAPGSLHTTNSNDETRGREDGLGDFKLNYLISLQELGLDIHAAYGNKATDIYAYEGAGIPLERTYIAGQDHGGEGGTVAIGSDYVDHLEQIADEPAPDQPFLRPTL